MGCAISKIPIRFLLLGFCALWCGCSSSPSEVEDDGKAPARITDLEVAAFDAHTVTLRWTATGDDGVSGTAARYDLRYLPYPLDWLNWDEAIPVTGEPAPQPAGTGQEMVVTGLHPDTTYYFALEILDEEGNCEGLSNIVEQHCFEDLPVFIPDPQLEGALRQNLAKPSGDILESDLRTVHDLVAETMGIEDLTGLEACGNLHTLLLKENDIRNLAPLAGLSDLWTLDLRKNEVVDLGPLAEIVSLVQLYLGENAIEDIAPLADMVLVRELDLNDNAIEDLTPLQGYSAIETLFLSSNLITNLQPLAGLASLRWLYINSNNLGNIDGLAGLSNLEFLDLNGCGITDIGGLAGLSGLQGLVLNENPIGDFTPLEGQTGLRTLVLIATGIENLTPLRNLTHLEYLHLYNNQIVDIDPLVQNDGFGDGDQVNLQSNPLSQQSRDEFIPALQARGVIVTY